MSNSIRQFWTDRLSTKYLCHLLSIFLIVVALTIGIVVVCLKSPKGPDNRCHRDFQLTVQMLDSYISAPKSIASGYLNNDRVLDIVVTNSATNNIAVFFGYSNGTFGDRMIYSTGPGSQPSSVAIGDFNGDKLSDIVVTGYGSHQVELFLGYGNGTFASQASFIMGSSRPWSIAIGDLNNDTYTDMVVVSQGANVATVYLGFGNGSFQSPMFYEIGDDSIPYYVITCDINNDGLLDVAVANSGSGTIGLFLGYGDGTLNEVKTYSMRPMSMPYALAAGDFDQNNQTDLVVINAGTNEIVIMGNYDNRSFESRTSITLNPSSRPGSVVLGDFNNDKHLDIAVTNSNESSISLLLGYGNGKFANHFESLGPSAAHIWSMTAGDFNYDQKLDFAIANYGLNSISVFISAINGFGGKRITPLKNSSYPYRIANGNFNNDTNPDLAVANYDIGTVDILLSYGDGTFFPFDVCSTGAGSYPTFLSVVDLNHDTRADIIVVNQGTDNIGIFLGYGNGSFSHAELFSTSTGSNPSSLATADFNNDGHMDMAVANSGTDQVGIFLGYGNGSFRKQISYQMQNFSRPVSIIAGDFTDDNRIDLIVSLPLLNEIDVILGNGDGTFQSPLSLPIEPTSQPVVLTSGDFNKDNKLDIAGLNSVVSSLYISFGYGNGSFGVPMKYSTGPVSYPADIEVDDLNHDAILDIVVTNYQFESIGLFFGYGNGTFASLQMLPINSSHPVSITLNDFNADGWIDIVVLNNNNNNIVVFLGNFYIQFEQPTSYLTGFGSHPYFIAMSDFNKDNKTDIVIANSFGDNIAVLYGFGNGSFKIDKTYSTGMGTCPYGLAVADFNNDKLLDIAFANWYGRSVGLLFGNEDGTFERMMTFSTLLQATPSSIVAEDLNNDSRLDIVVAQPNTDSIGLFLGHNYTDFLNIATKSTEYLSYPTDVAIGDFNKDSYFDIVVSNINLHNIGIFFGVGGVTFSNQVTYSTGSQSFPSAIALDDFNSDSQLDIAVVLHNPESIGILLGYGNGTFAYLRTFSSGSNSRLQYITVEDFNNDHHQDIAVINTGTNSIGIFLGYGNGSFGAPIVHSLGANTSPSRIAVDDFNQDGNVDVTVAISNDSNIGILFGHGNGTFGEIIKYSASTGTMNLNSIAVGDFNNDNRTDIVVVDSVTKKIALFFGRNNGSFENAHTFSTGSISTPISVFINDFNQDKLNDIIILSATTPHFGIFYGYGNGNFTIMKIYTIGIEFPSVALATGDINNDNKMDIILASFYCACVAVLVATDSKPFSDSMLYVTGVGSSPYYARTGDFNDDNYIDIVVTNTGTANIGILLGNGNGTLRGMKTYTTGSGSYPMSTVVGYVNNDQCLDIAVGDIFTDKVIIFLGKCDGTFPTRTFYAMEQHSIPMSIVLGDFDKDSVTDIGIASYGSNTVVVVYGYGNGTFGKERSYSVGYGARPISIAADDIDRDGWLDMTVSNLFTSSLHILLNSC